MNIPFVHEEYLIKRGIYYDKKLKELEKTYKQLEVEECTFKPITNKHVRASSKIFSDCEAMNTSKMTRRDRETEEVEFEKSKQECTFKPDLNKGNMYKRAQAIHAPITQGSKPSYSELAYIRSMVTGDKQGRLTKENSVVLAHESNGSGFRSKGTGESYGYSRRK